ncbi:PRC-barrel domain-containing protein [Calothrix sp. NIES-3974]|uniref:PRC-barrel domain-containing protein n=1 Tax=Calothrix sp. NIES-3974 TaxID=2005462 RepID=UPI000B5E0388|nr:PRC-barrel domain-containing protein [Calothrix sp. NIES-3974]BAZ05967.1 PRC-barrel domain-containing protein [Calothrix sp. NIES-3974]
MTSEQIRRSDILNTQVVTSDNGKRLGIVNQIWVDVEQREVVALGLKDSLIAVSSIPRYMYLDRISKIGDVILVENEDVIEDIDVELLSNLINWEVITETEEVLGRVRGFTFHRENGKLLSIIIASLGLPQIPDRLISTYEISIDEVVSTGPNRLIVFEGAEERVNQLSVGILESLGIGRAPWERDGDEEYAMPKAIAPSNQLPSGIPLEPPRQKLREPEPVEEEVWDEDYYEEEPPRRQVMEARPEPEPAYYDDEEEEDNWSEATGKDSYSVPVDEVKAEDYIDHDLEKDAWDDDAPQPINIPQKVKEKQPEYEEEGY